MKKNSKRLESIKAGHKTKKVSSTVREEDYLVTPTSVTKMLQKLDEKKYLEYEKYHGINLTTMGKHVADSIRRKHSTLLEFFEILNIGKEIANQDTEGLEHHLSDKTIKQLKKYITFLKSNPKIIKQFHEF